MNKTPMDDALYSEKSFIRCPVEIPAPETAKTPTQRIGLENAHRFKDHVELGVNQMGDLPMHNGHLNLKAIAEKLKFSRGCYSTNDYFKLVVEWAEKQLGCGSRQPASSGSTEKERELEREVQRVKNRLAQVLVSLEEANARLRETGYHEERLADGQVRLPW